MNSVDEVKVLTGTLPAEYGHSTSGVITTVKKSGTNEFHGGVSDYGRTRIMTHRQYFNLYTTAQSQPGNPNGVPAWFMMPDGNGGGPVVIPKIYNGRNKTFWYSGYSKLIEKKTQAYTSVTPTPDELQGDFTFGGLGQPLYDPATTRQNAGRHLDARSISDPGDSAQPLRSGVGQDPLLQHLAPAEYARIVQQHRSGEQFHLQSAVAHVL